jgi:hypothetical protein
MSKGSPYQSVYIQVPLPDPNTPYNLKRTTRDRMISVFKQVIDEFQSTWPEFKFQGTN